MLPPRQEIADWGPPRRKPRILGLDVVPSLLATTLAFVLVSRPPLVSPPIRRRRAPPSFEQSNLLENTLSGVIVQSPFIPGDYGPTERRSRWTPPVEEVVGFFGIGVVATDPFVAGDSGPPERKPWRPRAESTVGFDAAPPFGVLDHQLPERRVWRSPVESSAGLIDTGPVAPPVFADGYLPPGRKTWRPSVESFAGILDSTPAVVVPPVVVLDEVGGGKPKPWKQRWRQELVEALLEAEEVRPAPRPTKRAIKRAEAVLETPDDTQAIEALRVELDRLEHYKYIPAPRVEALRDILAEWLEAIERDDEDVILLLH